MMIEVDESVLILEIDPRLVREILSDEPSPAVDILTPTQQRSASLPPA